MDVNYKSKTPGNCGFPLANPHSGECVYFVPTPRFLLICNAYL